MNPALVLTAMQALLVLIDNVAAKQAGGGQLSDEYITKKEAAADALDALADSLTGPNGNKTSTSPTTKS